MSFDITIENTRPTSVTVYNLDGSILAHLGPNEKYFCSTDDPYLPLARYERVVFTKSGVELTQRSGWTEPERRWPVMLEVKDGPAVEHRFFNGAPLVLMKGIPVIVDCPLAHEWSIYSHVLLNVAEQRRIPSTVHDGCYEFISVLTDQPTLRCDEELEMLQKEVEAVEEIIPSVPALTPEERARVESEIEEIDDEETLHT